MTPDIRRSHGHGVEIVRNKRKAMTVRAIGDSDE
jgi:hypothetical protein